MDHSISYHFCYTYVAVFWQEEEENSMLLSSTNGVRVGILLHLQFIPWI